MLPQEELRVAARGSLRCHKWSFVLPQEELCVAARGSLCHRKRILWRCVVMVFGFGDVFGDDFLTADSNPMSKTAGNSPKQSGTPY